MLKTLLRYESLFWLAACTLSVFFSPVSSPILFTVFALALPGFALLRRQAGLPVFLSPTIAAPIIGLLTTIALSAVVTPNLIFSLRKISGLINGIGLFISLTVSAHKTFPSWLLLVFGIVTASVGAIGSDIYARIPLLFPLFRLFYLTLPLLPNVQRVINANLIAGVLLWTISVSTGLFCLYWQKNRWVIASLMGGAVAVQTFMLLIMQSRAAFLAITAAALSVIGLLFPRKRKIVRNGVMILTTAAALLLLPIWSTALKVELQNSYFALLAKGNEENSLDSITARVKIWQRSLQKIGEKPLTGHGLNIFRTIANTPTSVFVPERAIPHAHNWPLQIILELGIGGLICYGWLLGLSFSNLKERWQTNPKERSLTAGYAAALIAFLVFGLFDTISPGARPDFIFWIWLAGALMPASKSPIQPESAEANHLHGLHQQSSD